MSGTEPPDPVLHPETDPVYLVRLYPEQAASGPTMADLTALAVAQGQATAEAGALIEASQQEPVAGSPEDLPPTTPPANVDVPAVTQTGTGAGSTLNCTMGNWNGTPTGYAYQWQVMGVNVGTNASSYTVQSGDVGLGLQHPGRDQGVDVLPLQPRLRIAHQLRVGGHQAGGGVSAAGACSCCCEATSSAPAALAASPAAMACALVSPPPG